MQMTFGELELAGSVVCPSFLLLLSLQPLPCFPSHPFYQAVFMCGLWCMSFCALIWSLQLFVWKKPFVTEVFSYWQHSVFLILDMVLSILKKQTNKQTKTLYTSLYKMNSLPKAALAFKSKTIPPMKRELKIKTQWTPLTLICPLQWYWVPCSTPQKIITEAVGYRLLSSTAPNGLFVPCCYTAWGHQFITFTTSISTISSSESLYTPWSSSVNNCSGHGVKWHPYIRLCG